MNRMKIDRMFKIIYLLMSRDKMTAKELAEHLEVSVRTIHRDIDSLMQAGVPVYTSRGSEGGVSLVDGFVLDKAVLSKDEQAEILFGLQSLPGCATGEDVLGKLGVLFGRSGPDWIEADFSRWGYERKDDDRFEVLRRAILGERSIRFRYAGASGGETQREVYPLKLVFKSKAWYLQAFCLLRGDYRTFKVNRMISVEIAGEPFDRASFSMPKPEEIEPRPYECVLLELVFEPFAAARVYDEFDIDSIEPSDGGGLHVLTRYPDGEYLYDMLASFGSAVEVVQPAEVREKLEQRK